LFEETLHFQLPSTLFFLLNAQETRCFDALAELYTDLGEDDIMFGLWKRRGATDETRLGVGQLQHGMLEQAQTTFLDALGRRFLPESRPQPQPSP